MFTASLTHQPSTSSSTSVNCTSSASNLKRQKSPLHRHSDDSAVSSQQQQQLLSWAASALLVVLCLQSAAGGAAADGGLGAGGKHGDTGVPCGGVGKDCTGRDVGPTSSQTRVQRDQPVSERQVSGGECKYPCNCTVKEVCKYGVNQVKDGCDCCFMCARQQGDLCNYRDKCDDEKGLYCDFKLDAGLRGICRARDAKPCIVVGKTFKDGEEFKPNCSQLCTCQDGRYACSSLCPQELRPPSTVHCRDAQLVAISGHCCREWVCPHSHSLIGPEDNYPNESPATDRSKCKIETTQWSSCSQTCGFGVSIRMTGDNDCQPEQQRRLCIVRPCETDDKSPQQSAAAAAIVGGKCRNTWRDVRKHIRWGKCESTTEHQLKYCSTCNRHKCCGPGKEQTVDIQFKCPGQQDNEPPMKMMMIKSCKCFRLKDCPFL